MLLRWLHTIWTYFWRLVFGVAFLVLLTGGIAFGLLQLEATRSWLVDRIERDYRAAYNSDLDIGSLRGTLPFHASLDRMTVTYPPAGPEGASGADRAGVQADTLLAVDHVDVTLDPWSLLRNRLSITGFSVQQPRLRLLTDSTGGYSLAKAFALARADTADGREAAAGAASTGQAGQETGTADPAPRSWIRDIRIIAPDVSVTGGSVYVDSLHGDASRAGLPQPLEISDLEASFFLELTDRQRFWDIQSLSMQLGDLQAGDIALSGQVYNDSRYLEFNGFTLRLGSSELELSGEVDGVNLYAEGVARQLREAHYNLELVSSRLVLDDFRELSPRIPEVGRPFDFSLHAEGRIDSLWVDQFRFGLGESYLTADGFVEGLDRPGSLRYRASLLNLVMRRQDVEALAGSLSQPHYLLLENLRADGTLRGTADSLGVDLGLESRRYGSLVLEGGARTSPPHRYDFSLDGTGVNAAPLLGHTGDSTRINFTSRMHGSGFRPADAVSRISATLTDSRLYGVPVDSLDFRATLRDGELSHTYAWRAGRQTVNGKGSIAFAGRETDFFLQGSAGELDLAQLLPGRRAPSTRLNLAYNMEFRGGGLDSLEGRANLDIARSVVGGDTLESHQFYVDLNRPAAESRSLRLTSSFMDLTLNGTIVPTRMVAQARFWADHLPERFRREVLLADSAGVSGGTLAAGAAGRNPGHTLSLDGNVQVKNVNMLRAYFPDLPAVSTDASVEFNLNTSGPSLLLSGTVDADTLRWGDTRLRDGNMQVTANVRSDRPFRDYASLEFQSYLGQVRSGVLELDSVATGLAVNRDSLNFTQQVGSVGGEASLDLALTASLEPDRLTAAVDRFRLGNENYAWQSEERPLLVYTQGGGLAFNDFVFRNREEFMRISGVMSADPAQSLEYTIRNVNLERISGLVQGQLSFSGQLNGDLLTRSLTRQPSVQGELRVRRFTLANRLVGDLRFSSRLNEADQHFDTRIEILTDSTRYGDYLESNNQVGQDIVLDGWFVAPDLDAPQDTVYHFDAQFDEVDLWVLSHIVNPLNRVEGRAGGSGWLTGNLRDYDFRADFRMREVYLRPSFLDTEYYATGPVTMDRQEGVVLDSLSLRDTQGGTGRLWGSIDLNDFRPITYIDLTLQMNRLRFLNNNYDPDLPFYGAVAGTGTAHLTGPNTDLLLRTERPVEVTSDSRITVPLLEETELNQPGRFIRFVDSFDQRDSESAERERGEITADLEGEALQRALENLTFNERFNLDLQFNAPDGVNVDLVFDRVTGESLSSRGTGQIRLTMQDEEVQMFGRYDITGGTYRFVASDVISRELDLEPGGSIVWQGDPANAQMNISAVYRARPDVSMLNYRGAGVPEGGLAEETGRRVPVELVVEITGTVSSVRNNYFFRLPNSLDLSSNSTLSYSISQINRDEQQKLLQAASILLTDRFIPVQNTDQATTSLSQSLTRGSTVFNPLISNQVISPLLSNQINSLLNSEVSRFDIDFNLNTYNQIDLGIALRLYNDRLILRREGQITGETSIGDRIGDLNATYRIRRGLSLTAFHRQDQVFGTAATGSQTADVTPSVDGIGMEAEVQFNTWQELKRRIGDFFRAVFGEREEEAENDEIAQEN